MVSEKVRTLLAKKAGVSRRRLLACYEPGFGISPSAHPSENFYGQQWTRDLAHATANFFAFEDPAAAIEAFKKLFKYQRADGALPYRIIKEYGFFHVVVGLGWLARPMFNLIEKRLKGNEEVAHYEGAWNGAEDTVPAVIIAAGALYAGSMEGREFVLGNLDKLERAVQFFRSKLDKKDGLAVVTHSNPDWTETIQRTGKLGLINVLWAQALGTMMYLSFCSGRKHPARAYRDEYVRTKASVLAQLYDATGRYFRSKAGEDRLDTGASVLGSLFLLKANEAARVQYTLMNRVRHWSGLVNFDPPYSKEHIWKIPLWAGNGRYHNGFVWPWLTCQNIMVMAKIARTHERPHIRSLFKGIAVRALAEMALIFQEAGGVYEVLDPDNRQKAKDTPLYEPPKDFMASHAAFYGSYRQLVKLGWI